MSLKEHKGEKFKKTLKRKIVDSLIEYLKDNQKNTQQLAAVLNLKPETFLKIKERGKTFSWYQLNDFLERCNKDICIRIVDPDK